MDNQSPPTTRATITTPAAAAPASGLVMRQQQQQQHQQYSPTINYEKKINDIIQAAHSQLAVGFSELAQLNKDFVRNEQSARDQLIKCCNDLKAEVEQKEVKHREMTQILANLSS